MTEYTNEEIIANRRKWIDFLKEPDREKGTGRLENFYYPNERCCLGHACFILGAERTIFTNSEQDRIYVHYDGQEMYPSVTIWGAIGLKDDVGRIYQRSENRIVSFTSSLGKHYTFSALAELNDDTDITPQEIGEFLESVIEGGEGSPFIKLD